MNLHRSSRLSNIPREKRLLPPEFWKPTTLLCREFVPEIDDAGAHGTTQYALAEYDFSRIVAYEVVEIQTGDGPANTDLVAYIDYGPFEANARELDAAGQQAFYRLVKQVQQQDGEISAEENRSLYRKIWVENHVFLCDLDAYDGDKGMWHSMQLLPDKMEQERVAVTFYPRPVSYRCLSTEGLTRLMSLIEQQQRRPRYFNLDAFNKCHFVPTDEKPVATALWHNSQHVFVQQYRRWSIHGMDYSVRLLRNKVLPYHLDGIFTAEKFINSVTSGHALYRLQEELLLDKYSVCFGKIREQFFQPTAPANSNGIGQQTNLRTVWCRDYGLSPLMQPTARQQVVHMAGTIQLESAPSTDPETIAARLQIP